MAAKKKVKRPSTPLTAKKKEKILAEISEHGNVTAACLAAGISRTCFYNRKESDPAFAAEVEKAEQRSVDALIAEGRRRAMGYYQPIFDKDGKKTGEKFNCSDTLLIFLTKGKRPEYRDKFLPDLPQDTTFELTINTGKKRKNGKD